MNRVLIVLILLSPIQMNCKLYNKDEEKPDRPSLNNYLINDFANLIGLESAYAKERLEKLYTNILSECRLETVDNLIICKPILGNHSFSAINIYLSLQTITLVINNDGIVCTVMFSNRILFDVTHIINEENVVDEGTINMIKILVDGHERYSKRMIENDRWFNDFVKTTVLAVPVKPVKTEITTNENEKGVKYIWLGSEELYEYIGRNDINKIEYGFVYHEDYTETTTLWSMDQAEAPDTEITPDMVPSLDPAEQP